MLPITGLMAIRLSSNKLTFVTTDAVNYLYVSADKVEGDDFYVVVQAETFAKLISRMTCENISMSVEAENLVVTGNGKYTIELPLDEEGKPVRFPDPLSAFDCDIISPETIQVTTVEAILNSNKAALATTLDVPCYTGYYAGDNVVSTDTYKVCGMSVKLFNEPVLIRPETMDLLGVMRQENITVYRSKDTLVFKTDDVVIYGKVLEGIENYQIDAISGLLNVDYPSSCVVSKDYLLQVLDRLALFVSPYDKNSIYMTFTREGITLSSKKSSGTELIPYKESINFTDFTCCINIEMLRSQVKTHILDGLNIHYGIDNALKISDANVTQVIAFEEDDRA